MNLRSVEWLKLPAIVLGWATSTSALTLAMIFQGQFVPRNINGGGLYPEVTNPNPFLFFGFYAGSFAVCLVAAMAVTNPGRAIALFFPAYLGAALITWLVLSSPDFFVVNDPQQAVQVTATLITFNAFFPYLLLANFAGVLVGTGLGERLL